MKIQVLGAAEQVTGSCYYIQTETHKFLVDCGQFQGNQIIEKLNHEPLRFDPKELDFIILTHAHIDHTGRLPKIAKEGFLGKVYMTRGTASLSEILLKDSGKIHEYETERENEKREKAGLDQIEPYYTVNDAIYALQFFNPVDMEQEIHVDDQLSITFINAGHLLGSSHVLLTIMGVKYLFSGDIGTQHSEILVPPKPAVEADYIFMETTYGDRLHEDIDERFEKLHQIIMETVEQKGTVIIPAFSVGRTQDIIYGLRRFITEAFLKIPIYVDSPMAIHATRVFEKDTEGMKDEIVQLISEEKHPFDLKNLKFIDEAKTSYMLDFNKDPKVIISASGMCDAGRILHHLKVYLEKQKTNILFVGYQAEESIGRQIQTKKEIIRIYDTDVVNKAGAYTLHGFSGHADQNELIDWLSKTHPNKIFLIHGEENSLNAMAEKIHELYQIETYIPKLYEIIEL